MQVRSILLSTRTLCAIGGILLVFSQFWLLRGSTKGIYDLALRDVSFFPSLHEQDEVNSHDQGFCQQVTCNNGKSATRSPRIAFYMSPGRRGLAFNNYGDRLMYLTAKQQCLRNGANCTLANLSPYDKQQTQQFIEEYKPDAVWLLLGYAFASTFQLPNGRTKTALATEVVETLKNANVKVVLMPQAVGPFDGEIHSAEAARFFPLFDYVAVRDLASVKAIHGVAPNVKVHLIQDIVFSKTLQNNDDTASNLELRTSQLLSGQTKRPLIGLSLSRKMKSMSGGKQFDPVVRQLLTSLTTNATVVLIPHEAGEKGSDFDLVRYYYNLATATLGIPKSHVISVDVSSLDVELIEMVISRLDFLVVMRYHTMIVASRYGKAMAAFSWAPKYADFLNATGIGENGLLSFDNVETSLSKIWSLYDARSSVEPNVRRFAAKTRAEVDLMFERMVDMARDSLREILPCNTVKTHALAPYCHASPECPQTTVSSLSLTNTPNAVLDISQRRCTTPLASVPSIHEFSAQERLSREEPAAARSLNGNELDNVKNYDAARFLQHMASESLPTKQLSHDNLVALILKYQHQLEKGLAMPNRRTQFGVQSGVIKKLQTYCGALMTRFGSSHFILGATGSVIDQYIDFHKQRNEPVHATVTALRKDLISGGVTWQEKDGGISTVDKAFMLHLSQGDFASVALARHSIRQYAPRLNDDSPEFQTLRTSVIDAIRLAAEGTPSVCNRQGIKTVMVRDLKLIEQAIALQGGGRGHDPPEYLIMMLANLQIFRESRERNQAYVDGGLFSMSLMYALQSKGLATCSLNFAAPVETDQKMRQLLNVDDSHVIIMFLAVGRYRDEVVYTVSPRRASFDLQSIVREM